MLLLSTNREDMMVKHDRGIITLGYGSPKFIEMAKTLARSLKLHSPGIPRAIATDCPDDNEILELFDSVLPLRKEYGTNVRQKLYLDRYSPFEKTIFIDCDCIAVRDIEFIFNELAGTSFSVPGESYLTFGQKDPFVDVDKILNTYGIEKLPVFNGGLYYFEQNDITEEFFETARDILSKSNELGFYQFRGDGPGDEPIVSVAMTIHKQSMYQDSGRMMRTPIGIKGPLNVDVLTGKSAFIKNDKLVSPAVVHFAGLWNEHPLYYREATKLKNITSGEDNSANSKPASVILSQCIYQISLLNFYVNKLLKKL